MINSTIINLLLASVQPQQQSHEVNLINRLNDFFGFDNNIFLLDTLSDRSRYIQANENFDGNCPPKTVFFFDHNLDDNKNGTQQAAFKPKKGKNTFLIVVGETLKFGNNAKLMPKVKKIQQLDRKIKIGLFFVNKVTSTDTIENLFRRSWRFGIVNIFCAFYTNFEDVETSLNVFRFDPFVTFDLINVTGSETVQNYFPEMAPNYHRHPLHFFETSDPSVEVINHLSRFWDTVVRMFNATKSLVINVTRNMKVDIPVVENVPNVGNTIVIYPYKTSKLLLIVPHALPTTDIVAYLQNATWKRLFAYFFVTILSASLLLIVSRYLQRKKILLFQCVADVVNLLMNDNGAIRYGKLHWADIYIIVPLTFIGLIVMNGIVSVFQSYLTLTIYEAQIRTLDDLSKSRVPILIPELYDEILNEIPEDIRPHLGAPDKIHATDFDQMLTEAYAFNNSVAYFFDDNECEILLQMQKRLNLKAYHLTDTNLRTNFWTFVADDYFPYIEAVNDIIHRLQSAGLLDKWLNDDNLESIKEKWGMYRNIQFKSSNDSDEITVWTVLWCGWIASVILFVCEIIWYKIRKQIKKCDIVKVFSKYRKGLKLNKGK